MLKWAPYPFVRITLSFIAGILFYILLGREFEFSLEILAFFFLSFLVISFLAKRKKSAFYTHMAGLLGLFAFFASGLAIAHIRTQSHDNYHLLKLGVEPSHYIATIEDYVVQKPSYQSTVVQIEQALIDGQWQKVRGKVQLSVPHDSDKAYELNYGDVLLIRGSPQAVPPPANPNQFNYQEFLANRNVYYRHFLQHLQFTKLGNEAIFRAHAQ